MTTQTARKFFGILCLILLCQVVAFAQEDDDDNAHPYKKRFGFGGIATTNTIVEARTDSGSSETISFSYPGVSSFGAMLCYEISDRFMIEGAYIHTNNKKVLRDSLANPDGQQRSNVHQTIELSMRYLWNPYSRVVFYLSAGPTLFINDYDGGEGVKDDSLSAGRTEPVFGSTTKILGLSGGLGLFANIKTKYGMIVPGGEWRVDFFLSTEDRSIFKNKTTTVKSNISTYFSFPRFTLQFFPNF